MQDESQELQIVTSDAIYAGDKALADAQVVTAKQYPRNVTRATQNALAIATLDPETAQTCTYAVPRGGKNISGPSVHLAKILAQTWGNLRVDARVVNIDSTHVTSESVCWDLETNVAIKVQVKRSIMTRSGRMNDDMITVTGNAANSIALRNAVLAIVPRGIVDKVYKAAQGAITGDVSSEVKLMQRRKACVQRFKDMYQVEEKEVLSIIGKNSIDLITVEDLVFLVGVDTALKDGDTTVDEAFNRPKQGAANAGAPKATQKESERFLETINNCTTTIALEALEPKLKEKFPEHAEAYKAQMNKLLDQSAANS